MVLVKNQLGGLIKWCLTTVTAELVRAWNINMIIKLPSIHQFDTYSGRYFENLVKIQTQILINSKTVTENWVIEAPSVGNIFAYFDTTA